MEREALDAPAPLVAVVLMSSYSSGLVISTIGPASSPLAAERLPLAVIGNWIMLKP